MRSVIVVVFLLSQLAFATDDISQFDLDFNTPEASPTQGCMGAKRLSKSKRRMDPSEVFKRTQAVLNYFKVPAEADSQNLLSDLNGRQTAEGLARRLSILEMRPEFGRFSAILNANNQEAFYGFQDRDVKQVPDFSLYLAPSEIAPAPQSFHWRLVQARGNPSDRPLQNLRVAIDPGHMGGTDWDQRTGKYIIDRSGAYLSEGVMALQTALLVEAQLRAWGAETMLTHREIGPVSKTPFEKLNIDAFWRQELRHRSLQTWFMDLLSSSPVGRALFDRFDRSSQVQRLRSEKMREDYYIFREDLDSRVGLIENFKPDLVVIIHYDAAEKGRDAHGVFSGFDQRTKAYVPGAFYGDEFSTRKARREFVRHLLEERTFEASVQLSQSMVQNISNQLNIPVETNAWKGKLVAPGVISRNLNLTRQVTSVPTTYLEVLYYNQAQEFEMLKQKDHTLNIGGQTTYYSERLRNISVAISQGVNQFVRNYQ